MMFSGNFFHLYIMLVTVPLIAGFLLDAVFGDPLGSAHPVVFIGRLISLCDRKFRKGGNTDFTAGILTVVIVCAVSAAVPALVLYALYRLAGGIAGCAAASLLCWQMIAARDLCVESRKVQKALDADDTEGARRAVSMIVGRDTERLDRKGIIKAAVETVAENASDGVTAPLLFMAVFGVPGMYFYKAVNTMDSMIGYKNEKYLYFGRAAARLDDVLNFIPARLTGLLMIAAAELLPGMDGKSAAAVFVRDRKKSASPNAGCTEAAAAGAMHIRLLGPAYYFGRLFDKPYIGNDDREPVPGDITGACRLMYVSSVFMLALLTVPFLLAYFL